VQENADAIVQLLTAHANNAMAVKYVEPLSDDYSSQLINLEAARVALSREFSAVTMLVTGRGALPLRRKLAEKNDLYYCALEEEDRAAEGQGVLAEELEHYRNRSN
jgi:hypothetical protein